MDIIRRLIELFSFNSNLAPTKSLSFELSRSKLELFLACRRCFYLNYKFGVKQPGGRSFSLNNAVDALLKKEFDSYRKSQ